MKKFLWLFLLIFIYSCKVQSLNGQSIEVINNSDTEITVNATVNYGAAGDLITPFKFKPGKKSAAVTTNKWKRLEILDNNDKGLFLNQCDEKCPDKMTITISAKNGRYKIDPIGGWQVSN